MASGCIIGTCPECGEIIYEDQWTIAVDDGVVFEITHEGKCAKDRFRRRYGMSESQFQRAAGIPGIEKDLLALSDAFQKDLKDLEGRYRSELDRLLKRLQSIKNEPKKRGGHDGQKKRAVKRTPLGHRKNFGAGSARKSSIKSRSADRREEDVPYVVISRAEDGCLDVVRFDKIKKGDLFMVNGFGIPCGEEPHESGDASYTGWLLYDDKGDCWFPEDLDRWEDVQL